MTGDVKAIAVIAAAGFVLWAVRVVRRERGRWRQQRRDIHGLVTGSLAFNREHLEDQRRLLRKRQREYLTIGGLPADIDRTRRHIRDLERQAHQWAPRRAPGGPQGGRRGR